MSRLTRDGTAEPFSRDQNLRRERGQGKNNNFPWSANHEQDRQPSYPVDPYSAICHDHTHIHRVYYLIEGFIGNRNSIYPNIQLLR